MNHAIIVLVTWELLTFTLVFRIDDIFEYNRKENEYLIRVFYVLTCTHIRNGKILTTLRFHYPPTIYEHVCNIWGNAFFCTKYFIHNSILFEGENDMPWKLLIIWLIYKTNFLLWPPIRVLMLWFSIMVLEALKTVCLG